MTMRRFLIRIVQVFALAIIGTGLLVDTSFAATNLEIAQALCSAAGGTPGEDAGRWTCTFPTVQEIGGRSAGYSVITCKNADNCTLSTCGGQSHRHGCISGPFGDKTKGKPSQPSKREGTTTISAGTCADRGICNRNPGAKTL